MIFIAIYIVVTLVIAVRVGWEIETPSQPEEATAALLSTIFWPITLAIVLGIALAEKYK